MLDGFARLRERVAAHPSLEDMLVETFQLGERSGLLGFVDRIAAGSGTRTGGKKAGDAKASKHQPEREKLAADVRTFQQAHPDATRRQIAVALLPANKRQNPKAIDAKRKQIARLPE